MRAASKDLDADRWTPFVRRFTFVDRNFTGATFAAAVRMVLDAPGAPQVDLGSVASSASQGVWLDYAGTDTVQNHIAAGRLREVPPGLEMATPVAVSVVGIRINETTMEGLPFPAERGDVFEFFWDLHVTPAGSLKYKAIGGKFRVHGGATQ